MDAVVPCFWVFLTEGSDHAGWLRDYYDDENWMAMALVRAFEVTNDARFLERAVYLWKDITGAWDASCCGSLRGA